MVTPRWQVEILLPPDPADPRTPQWRAVRPTGGHPYTYATRLEACQMRAMCYPDQTPDQVRIVEVVPHAHESTDR